MFHLPSRAPFRYTFGPSKTSDHKLLRALLAGVRKADLLLLDNGFYSLAALVLIGRRGAHFLIPMKTSGRPKVLRPLGPSDYLCQIQSAGHSLSVCVIYVYSVEALLEQPRRDVVKQGGELFFLPLFCGLPHTRQPRAQSGFSAPSLPAVRLVAFSGRPALLPGAGEAEVSRFSCVKFLSMLGVYDYAGSRRFATPFLRHSFILHSMPVYPGARTDHLISFLADWREEGD